MEAHSDRHPALELASRRLERLNPDQFELYFEKNASTKIDSKDQEVESLTRSEDVGMAIRVIKDKKLGFSFTTSLEKEAVEKAVDTAFEIAQFMPEDEFIGLNSFGTFVYPNVDSHDKKGLQTPVQDKVALAKELEAICRKTDKRINGIRSAAISETSSEVQMMDSNGESISHRSTLYTASITCKAEQDGDSQMGSEFAFSNYLNALDIAQVGKLAARWATELLGASQAPTMQCPAIFRNSVVAELVEFLSSSFSAEEIAKGRSMLAGKEGQLIFSDQVTLIDDGLMAGGFATSPFDGEGIPCSMTTLIDGGFLSGTLYDGYYARKKKTEPTGNAVRGIKGPPSIGFSNLYMKKGKKTFDQLCDGVDKGILITDLMGVHTANPVTGDFSLGASGILIEEGKLTKPVRGFAVAGNILEVFRRMTDISNDLKFFGSVGAPSVRVSEISVGGI